MFAFLLVAASSNCATLEVCPTRKNLLEAATNEDAENVSALSNTLDEKFPESIHLVHSQRIKSVSHVLCGEAWSVEPPVVICRFTVRYAGKTVYKTAKLSKADGQWLISESLSVEKPKR